MNDLLSHACVTRRPTLVCAQVKTGLRLVGLDSDDSRLLTAAIFEESNAGGSTSVSALPCNVLLCCGKKAIERATFEAINSNSLVYDGRLVVDHNFCTNDPVVYAAGVITKFARRYRCKTSMELCSSREAGAKLAQALLPALDPLSTAPSNADTAPKMEKPRVEAATLPGGLHYLHIIAPSPAIDSYAAMVSHPTFGRELLSEPSGSYYKLCAVRLNKHGMIHSIVYLGSEVRSWGGRPGRVTGWRRGGEAGWWGDRAARWGEPWASSAIAERP